MWQVGRGNSIPRQRCKLDSSGFRVTCELFEATASTSLDNTPQVGGASIYANAPRRMFFMYEMLLLKAMLKCHLFASTAAHRRKRHKYWIITTNPSASMSSPTRC